MKLGWNKLQYNHRFEVHQVTLWIMQNNTQYYILSGWGRGEGGWVGGGNMKDQWPWVTFYFRHIQYYKNELQLVRVQRAKRCCLFVFASANRFLYTIDTEMRSRSLEERVPAVARLNLFLLFSRNKYYSYIL